MFDRDRFEVTVVRWKAVPKSVSGKLARSTTALNPIGKELLFRVRGATAMTLLSASEILVPEISNQRFELTLRR